MQPAPWLLACLAIVGADAAVSFLSIGDWGGAGIDSRHAENTYAVAATMAAKAEELGPSFIIGTGDNFYYYGVYNLTDSQFQTDFEKPYDHPSLMVPWYQSLGNHDYGFDVDAQLNYKSPNKNRWVLPDRYYTTRVSLSPDVSASIVVLDSSPCVKDYRLDDPKNWDPCGSVIPGPADCKFHQNILAQSCTEQLDWLKKTLPSLPPDDWVIMVAHHPIDEIDDEPELIDVVAASQIDLYLNGHTHALQYYLVDGKGAYVLTGAGAMVETVDQHLQHKVRATNHTVTSKWSLQVAGFTAHVFSEDFSTLTTTFYKHDGTDLYSFTTKRRSCKVIGCGKYSPANPCQCDSSCVTYNNCCPDYKTQC